jgi:hypothetical protein
LNIEAKAFYNAFSMSCKRCVSILGKYAKPHPVNPCPLEKALYCGVCACYGHTPTSCKRAYDISQNKSKVFEVPLPNIPQCPFTSLISVTDADAPVRVSLIANGIIPMTCQEKGKKIQRDLIENRKRLIECLKARGQTLLLITPKKCYDDT